MTKAIKMNSGTAAYVSKMRNKVAAEAPKVCKCPKCKRNREFKFFGVRTFKGSDGKPARFARQSYCVDCRSGKKPGKATASKPAPKAKVTTKAKTIKTKPAKKALKATPLAAPKAAPVQAPAPAAVPVSVPAPAVVVAPTPVIVPAPVPAPMPTVTAPAPTVAQTPTTVLPNGKTRRMGLVDISAPVQPKLTEF